MRAIAIDEFGGPDKLRPMALPRPRAEKGEVLLHVVAAGVNPVDWMIREGQLEDAMPHRFPLIPGWDVAGVVEELGSGTTRFRKGDRVWAYARKSTVQWGCYAEYVTVPESSVAMMPSKLLFEEAAAVPVAGLTAFQCLQRTKGMSAGQTVLIHAAAGGVGHLAVQLAKQAGAKVIGTGRSNNHPFILDLGAEACIDYTQEDFRDALRRHAPDGADVILDSVGGETLTRSIDALKPGGRLVSIVDEPDREAAAAAGVSAHSLIAEPNGEQLEILARMLDRKQLRTEVQKIYPLAKAADAHVALQEGHIRGKLVLNI
jgi:NADPH:quinone reductase-like Zn-dependent oxidoreductase